MSPTSARQAALGVLLEDVEPLVKRTEDLAATHGRVAAQFPIAPLQRLNHRDAQLDHLEALKDEPVTPDIRARLLRLTWLDAQVRHFALTDPRVRRA